MKIVKRRIVQLLGLLIVLYLILLIPDFAIKGPLVKAHTKPFTWNKDQLWLQLENDFRKAKQLQPLQLDTAIALLKLNAINKLASVQNQRLPATDSNLISIQNNFFSLAPLIAIKADELLWYTDYYNQVRNFIKLQSQHWNMQEPIAHNSVYSLLYGMRAAVEEVQLQSKALDFPSAMLVNNEKSVTPSTKIFGIEVHSGDLLVSRGGAEVSALISRGNDYPGNFSHIALLYVDEKTNHPFLIESHIEKGVAISSVEGYEKDKKLRFMVMRPRANLPAMMADPMLPQKAAKKMYDESFTRHIPYDFKMNYADSAAMFCSEVASYAYRKNGLQIWSSLSTISSQGVVNWLNDFGVENFVTQMPSDLEYDPQLSVVAEWRDPGTLLKDHLDNAVMDAMLQQANEGQEINYNIWQLPFVRIVKGYCVIKNIFGGTGLIPEGMSATKALKNQTFVAMNKKIKNHTQNLADDFTKQHHYRPPYWQLVKFAETAAGEK
jgi:hypothetical protein